MNTVHASLIPAGVHRGEVLLFDGNLTRLGPTSASGVSPTGTRSHQPWSIVNPYWPAANPNYSGTVTQPPPSVRQYWGPNVPIGMPPLGISSYQGFRDYPRLHALGVLDPISGGGTAPRLFVSGQPMWGMHWAHDELADPSFGAAVTTGAGYNIGQSPANGDVYGVYGTSLLMPSAAGAQQSQIVRIGGMRFFQTGASNLVETVQANIPATAQNSWSTSIPHMSFPRMHLNVVVLPTGELMAIGGEGPAASYHLIPELLSNGGTAWQDLAPHAGPRDYHSTALLLPDGRVFVAGGENRKTGPVPGPDYLIYEPQYFHLDYGSVPPTGIQVVNDTTGLPVQQDAIGFGGMQYGTTYRASWSNTLEDGITVAGAVLISPSSVTHHDDGGQRMVRLVAYYGDDDQSGPSANSIQFLSPTSERVAPPGWWMLFLVTSSGRPSSAYWVHLL